MVLPSSFLCSPVNQCYYSPELMRCVGTSADEIGTDPLGPCSSRDSSRAEHCPILLVFPEAGSCLPLHFSLAAVQAWSLTSWRARQQRILLVCRNLDCLWVHSALCICFFGISIDYFSSDINILTIPTWKSSEVTLWGSTVYSECSILHQAADTRPIHREGGEVVHTSLLHREFYYFSRWLL